MHALCKAVGILGLAGSVSLTALSATALEITESGPSSQPPLPPVISSGEVPAPLDRDVAEAPERGAGGSPAAVESQPTPTEAIASGGLPVVPEIPPATVTITAEDVAPRPPAADLSLPEPPSTAVTFTRDDWLRIAVTNLLADDSAMRDLQISRKDRDALAAFYAQSERPLLWAQDGMWSPAAQALAETIRTADEDGLDPTDYPLPDMGAPNAVSKTWSDKSWAEAELKLSTAAIRYARDARGGRIDPTRLSKLITPSIDLPQAAEVLASLSASKDPGIVLNSYNPPHPGYQALKAKLARLRENSVTRPIVRVPNGPTLRLGMRDPRVPLIRARFNLGPTSGDETAYDERVASAVAAFQKERGLTASGALNAQTVAALSGPSAAQLERDLIANMERWRWLPRDLGAKNIMVNVPEFRLRLTENGKLIHETKVIVGKPDSQTPIFSNEMKYLVVNPSWTVPPSILKKEFLPALAVDPDYAAKRGYKIVRHGNRISIQQPPGERNALGWVKFMFPNNYAVYLHDTPNRSLFSAAKRAFSHGCVRVEQPFELAEEVVGSQGWPEQKLRRLIGKGERYINLREPLPVHLTYFTVSVDEHGVAKVFDDLYGLNRKVRAALGLDS